MPKKLVINVLTGETIEEESNEQHPADLLGEFANESKDTSPE